MLPAPAALMARSPSFARHLFTRNNPTGTLASMGVVASDLLIVGTSSGDSASTSYAGPTSGSGQAWTFIFGGAQGGSTWYRFATAADLAASLGNTGPDFYLTAYRGARTLVSKAKGTAPSAASATIAGFTSSGRHAGILAALGNVLSAAYNVTAPATFINRFLETSSANVGLYDRLYPANSRYAGASFTITGGTSGSLTYNIMEMLR